MLGWEFPPFITGGLGTACHGLTKALDRRGVDVTFVLPKPISRSHSAHVRLISPGSGDEAPSISITPRWEGGEPPTTAVRTERRPGAVHRMGFLQLEESGSGSYARVRDRLVEGIEYGSPAEYALRMSMGGTQGRWVEEGLEIDPAAAAHISSGADYGGDLLAQAGAYAHFCMAAARSLEFDVIHAHDWMTYPAGIALARLSGRPLVAHVHSTEFDRSGDGVNQVVYNIERRGMHAAVRVLAVSMLTKNLCTNRYGVRPDKIDVVYNGVDLDPAAYGMRRIERDEKIVLYFGRITLQKGPEYFVRAAKRVLEVMPNVRFVVAGSGDQATRMIEMAASLGIGSRMTFTGFLRGGDIPRVFSMADVYVMPSVSEPFGIAPLEALAHRVPVIISRTSGVSEVLTHALKVDFWDVDDIANKVVAVLRHPPLRGALREDGLFEVRGLTWDGAALRCESSYRQAIDSVRRRVSA